MEQSRVALIGDAAPVWRCHVVRCAVRSAAGRAASETRAPVVKTKRPTRAQADAAEPRALTGGGRSLSLASPAPPPASPMQPSAQNFSIRRVQSGSQSGGATPVSKIDTQNGLKMASMSNKHTRRLQLGLHRNPIRAAQECAPSDSPARPKRVSNLQLATCNLGLEARSSKPS